MDFDLSPQHLAFRARAGTLARECPNGAMPPVVAAAAARAGLADPGVDLVTLTVALETLAIEASAAAVSCALHLAVQRALPERPWLRDGAVGALGLSSEMLPDEIDGRLSGRAGWIAPVTDGGVAVIGARRDGALAAYAVRLGSPGVSIERIETGALPGTTFGHVTLDAVAADRLGAPQPLMATARILLSAAGLGLGRRALKEALSAARALRGRGAGGEQTVQGLLADAATELDAASVLVWRAALTSPPSLAEASMAKLAATEAAQRAVARATQVVGIDTFREGHVIAQLARDVRALELFAGRTEALREAVAAEILPPAGR